MIPGNRDDTRQVAAHDLIEFGRDLVAMDVVQWNAKFLATGLPRLLLARKTVGDGA